MNLLSVFNFCGFLQVIFSLQEYWYISFLMAILLVLLIMVSFWSSGMEVALFSLSKEALARIKSKNSLASTRLSYLHKYPKEVLVTLVLVNTFVNIGIILLMNILLKQLFSALHTSLSWLISVVVEVLILVIFAEITPKVWASKSNIQFVQLGLWTLVLVFKVLKPLATLISRISKSSEYIFNKVSPYKMEETSAAGLDRAISLTRDREYKKEEIQLLQSVVRFREIKVRDVKCSRLDIHALNVEDSFDEIKQKVLEYNYSRLPVYKNDLDHIVGVLYIKDVLPYLKKKNFHWQKLLRPPFVVYEFNDLETLLLQFREKSLHFAIVLDEYGNTQGVITLEDVLEEIIGDINDEFDEDQPLVTAISENEFMVEGQISLTDFLRHFDVPAHRLDEIKQDSDSLAGLILELSQAIPTVNHEVQWDKFRLIIEEVKKNRITKVKVLIKANG